MSEKLPRITADKAIKVIEKRDFVCVRQSGSHKIYKNVEGVRITVPYHSGKILHPKILRNILNDVDLTISEFKDLM